MRYRCLSQTTVRLNAILADNALLRTEIESLLKERDKFVLQVRDNFSFTKYVLILNLNQCPLITINTGLFLLGGEVRESDYHNV